MCEIAKKHEKIELFYIKYKKSQQIFDKYKKIVIIELQIIYLLWL